MKVIFEIDEEEFLFQAIKSPTRLREGNNPSILDVACTKYPGDGLSMQMLAPLGNSDQHVVLLELHTQLQEDKHLPLCSWFYQKTRKSELVKGAKMSHRQQISSLAGVTDIWHAINYWFLDLRNKFVTYSPKKAGKDAPWIRVMTRVR